MTWTDAAVARRATHRIMGIYLLIAAVALAFPHRPPAWLPLAVIHVLGAAMLLGLLPPTSGVVRLFGEPPSRGTRGRLGYVPQGLGLYEDLTVEENLAFAAAAFQVEVPSLDPELQRVRGVLVRDLSLGVLRRVAFAKALAHRPSLLVLDEPTSGVDPLGRARLWDTIRASAEAPSPELSLRRPRSSVFVLPATRARVAPGLCRG